MTTSLGARRDVHPGWYVLDAFIHVDRRLRRLVSRGRVRQEAAGGYLLVAPAAIVCLLLFAGVVDLAWKSFHSFDPSLQVQHGVSLSEYRQATSGFIGAFYMHTLRQTILISAAVTVSSIVLAFPIAYFMARARSRTLRMVVLSLLLIPFLMGEIVRAFAWLLLFGREGLVARAAAMLRLSAPHLLGTETAVWIGMLQVMVPIAGLMLFPSLARVPPDLEQAARTLGARPRQIWQRIVIPLAAPGAFAAMIAVFSLSMTSFAIPQVLGEGRRPFIANTVQSIAFDGQNIYLASALGMMLVAVVTVVVIGITLMSRLQLSSLRRWLP